MKKVLCSLAVGIAALSFGQINDNQGFEVDNGNYSNVSFFRSKTTPVCEGSYALIRSFWSGGKVGSTTFSSFSSNGASITVDFKYRTYLLGTSGKVEGSMKVEYSADGGTTYKEIGNFTLDKVMTCTTFSYQIPQGEVPKNAGFKLRVSGEQAGTGDFYLILDDFKISQGTLAVSDVAKNDVKIYPNPVKNMLIIKSSSKLTEAKISDFSGRLIKAESLKDNKIDVSSIKAGSYMITVTDENSKQTTSKFVKN
ncbi:T9SS type A sorting domain-containing protein [Soonwooa sp.]|uniref:T9SS type A sorting domain-containing protein n=1 Tax=Soonwooa sp. TaxID=1938592 RepID=UPI0035AD9831